MWRTIITIIIISFLGYGLYGLVSQNKELDRELDGLTDKLQALESENVQLKRDIDYFQKSENLIKEFKKHFNYRESGEELIIIVPEER